MEKQKKLNVGMVGFGSMGKTHAFAIHNLPYYYGTLPFTARIAGLCTTSYNRSVALCEQYGFGSAARNFDELIARDDIDIIDIDTDNKRVKMNVSCSKGTYIRTLCADIGDEIGTGAYMETLRRTKSGCFTIQYSYTPEEIEQIAKADCLKDYILPMDDVFSDLDKVILDDFLTAKYKNGIKIRRKGLVDDSYYLVYGTNNELLGISKYNGEELVMWKSLWS